MALDTRGLIAGLVFTLGIFAIKAGAGFGYALAHKEKGRDAAGVLAAYLVFMALVFLACNKAALAADSARAGTFLSFLSGRGMVIHFAMWAVLMLWGVILLSSKDGYRVSHAWLFLSAPCPVCIAVIVMDLYLFAAIWPKDALRSLWFPYLFFALSVTGSAAASALFYKRVPLPSTRLLGWLMIMCSSYFLTNILFLPNFRQAALVYEMSIRQAAVLGGHGNQFLIPLLTAMLLFFAGFVKKMEFFKSRGKTCK